MAGICTVSACASAPGRAPRVPVRALDNVPTSARPREPCVPASPPQTAPGWELIGWPSVPRVEHVDRLAGRLVATTTSEMCVSDDDGRHWRAVLDHVDWSSFAFAFSDNVDLREALDPSPPAARDVDLPPSGLSGLSGTQSLRHVTAHGVDGDFSPIRCGSVMYLAVQSPTARQPPALRSIDGGITWQSVNLPWPRSGTEVAFACAGDGVIAVRLSGESTGGESYSADHGETWRRFTRPPVDTHTDVSLPAALPQGCTLSTNRALLCEDDNTSWASDDGVHWHRAGSPTGGQVFLYPDGTLLGVGGGVALSRTTGRRWNLIATAPGHFNLGTRGGALSVHTFWLAGTALWWTDDGGLHWVACPLPWQLIGVLDRRRVVGLGPPTNPDACGGEIRVSQNSGRSWRATLHAAVRSAWMDGDLLRVMTCDVPAREFSSHDGVVWRHDEVMSPEPDAGAEPVVEVDGMEVRLEAETLRIVGPFDPPEVLAAGWPRGLVPVAAHATHGAIDAVVFGNGTVLRRQ